MLNVTLDFHERLKLLSYATMNERVYMPQQTQYILSLLNMDLLLSGAAPWGGLG